MICTPRHPMFNASRTIGFVLSHPNIWYADPMNRDDVLSQLLTVFRSRGYEGATISEIAKATGLGKASLYHHFPGGKQEMTEALVRMTLSRLNAGAFAPLYEPGPPKERLLEVLDGWNTYLDDGNANCLLGVLMLGTAKDLVGAMVTDQFNVWLNGLADLYEKAGKKPKAAARCAHEFVAELQGAVVLARIQDSTKHYTRTHKSMAKAIRRL